MGSPPGPFTLSTRVPVRVALPRRVRRSPAYDLLMILIVKMRIKHSASVGSHCLCQDPEGWTAPLIVINMRLMFSVRSSPCPAPHLHICSQALSSARCVNRGRPPPTASRLPDRMSPHTV